MSRPWRIGLGVLILAVLVAAGVLWWLDRAEPIPTAVPAAAPTVGSCWTVDPAKTRAPLPRPRAPVGCAQPHTAQGYQVGPGGAGTRWRTPHVKASTPASSSGPTPSPRRTPPSTRPRWPRR